MRRGDVCRDRAAEGASVDVDAPAVDVRPAEECGIRQITGFIDARFRSVAIARAVAGVIEDQHGRMGRTEVSDNRPNGADGFTVTVKP